MTLSANFSRRKLSQWGRAFKSSYANTIHLPKTSFPQKVEGQKRIDTDKRIVSSESFQSIYYTQFKDRTSGPEFILHDGPPYANGDTHLGHAVNKILKDITNRAAMIKGKRVHYRPGWDCHGLPIELKARQANKSQSHITDPLEIRRLARDFASKTIESQKKDFMSWGVMGDWNNSYTTMHPDFVKGQLWAFLELFEAGLVNRRYMPVYWSPATQTALAESELEYNKEHISQSIYVRFEVCNPEEIFSMPLGARKKLYLLVWTTTPWTLMANKAVCVNSSARYAILENNEVLYVIGEELLKKNQHLKHIFQNSKVISTVPGEKLQRLRYIHPLEDILTDNTIQEYPVFVGKHVTLDAGTGLVHTAPSHGQDDYIIGINNNLNLDCQVNEQGQYDETCHKDLQGLHVLSDGNRKIIEMLRIKNHILLNTELKHSYPYDWRSKTPVILRGSKQWFIDTNCLQEKGLRALQGVNISPETSKNGFQGVLENRPYWCISRQRVWGVPIPVFYNEDDLPVINKTIIEKICHSIDNHGTDSWWTLNPQEFLDGDTIKSHKNMKKGTDIFDVWIDSGITWRNVLGNDSSITQKHADLYLEGLDQFSGWFYSSLLTGIALRGSPPFKQIFVHGFTLDENGRKMSKSLGNVVSPLQITEGKSKKAKSNDPVYGVDVLRWWVASHSPQGCPINVSKNSLDLSKKEVDTLRNRIKFLLGNIPITMTDNDCLDHSQMLPLDRYILHLISKHIESLSSHYDSFRYHKVCQDTNNLVANDLSSFYFHLVKDRLYCCNMKSVQRKSAVTAIWYIFTSLRSIISPILPILGAETSEHLENLHVLPLTTCFLDTWRDDNLEKHFQLLLALRANLLQQASIEGNSDLKQVEVELFTKNLDVSTVEALKVLEATSSLRELFQSSVVRLIEKESSCGPFSLRTTSLNVCPRCRLFLSAVPESLCPKCVEDLK